MAEERPPRLLQIYRDFVKPGSERAFRQVEEDAARICADLDCPNVHLAMESLAAPAEVWWLTPYVSEADNSASRTDTHTIRHLMAALEGIAERKAGLVGTPVDVIATYRAELSRAAWKLAGARFVVVTMTTGDSDVEGAAFATADGTSFIFRAFAAGQEAEACVINRARTPGCSPYVHTGACRRRNGLPPIPNSGNQPEGPGIEMRPALVVGCFLACASSAVAQDRVLGLLTLPEVFGNGACDRFSPQEVRVARHARRRGRWDRPRRPKLDTFQGNGGCEGLEVAVRMQGAAGGTASADTGIRIRSTGGDRARAARPLVQVAAGDRICVGAGLQPGRVPLARAISSRTP